MPHNWVLIPAGRVCTECSTAQAKDEFEDDGSCPADNPQGSAIRERRPPRKG